MIDCRSPLVALLLGWLLLLPAAATAQSSGTYDTSWYDPDAPHLQIAVTSDGVYRVEASALKSALPDGTSLSQIPPETIRLIENGREIPIQMTGTSDGTLDETDTIAFVGRRNRGTDELWAYNFDTSAQSSTYHSLYSDTTYYWMTWGGANGLRYSQTSTGSTATPVSSLRDTLRVEAENRYYFGRPQENGNSLYTESEGYYWRRFAHNDTAPITFTDTLAVGRRTPTGTELHLSVRLDGATNSCHRVTLEGRLQQSGGGFAFEPLRTREWQGFQRVTLRDSIDQDRIPDTGLAVRLTSQNDNFSNTNCPNPSSTPNYVLLDWFEAAYTRSLEATAGTQRFVASSATQSTFQLTGHAASTVHVYNPTDARRFAVTVSDDTASFTDTPSSAPLPYWAVSSGEYRSPAAVLPDQSSDWHESAAHGADYLILTTQALQPSAQKLADYRRSHDGYDVEVALVEDVFDEFDYGRPTPIAIRRFVRAAQDWSPAPRFLTIFGDAQYPIRDGSVSTLYPEWSVPSFGYSPSDGWFAMQTDGPNDWSEVLAVGRIPVRSVAQGDLFIDKLKTYEGAPLEQWQKRMLLLAGGTSQSEQQSLQFYSNRWGEIASDTIASVDGQPTPVNTGMDTIRYYKEVNDALDASFQDSLAVDLKRGSGWLNYFGHSAAQTWEIVTDPPSEFDNAGRLPIVVSLGCRTGSFAGGQFEEKSAPSLGEQLVVGSVRPDGTPRDGARNGGIAHFGESALGNRLPSARLNDALIQRVFVDTMRVLGAAIRDAKEEVASNFGSSSLYVKHLLQYGLLGDPATNMALPKKPDLHVASNLISIRPTAPTPGEQLDVRVEVQNRGMIPSDSVEVSLTWERPDGSTIRRRRTIERFRLKRSLQFAFSLSERALGQNTFRVRVDPKDEYGEVRETNNSAQRTQVVFDTGVSLISPTDNSTVPSSEPTLEFTVSRQTDAPSLVRVQLDSVPDFSSPGLRETYEGVTGIRGTWTPTPLEPNRTYWWRARIANASQNTWKTGRFSVIPSLPDGTWLQQGRLFRDNDNVQISRADRSWTLEEFPRTVLARSNFGNGEFVNGFTVDGVAKYEYLQLGFGVLVMNGNSGEVRESESFPTYDLQDQYEDEVGDQQQAIDSLAAFLDEVPQEGDLVFVRTRHLARESGPEIPGQVKSLFRNLGTNQITSSPHTEAIDTLTYNDLWVMKARKGDPSKTIERTRSRADTNQIGLETRHLFSHPGGQTLTSRIGPVSGWNTLSWTGSTPDASDKLEIEVLAADSTVLIDDLSGRSGQQSLSQIDPTQHPYLRLRATLTDSTTRTAPQLKRWSVSYEGVPELVVDPAGLQSVPDTLAQGKDARVTLPVINLGRIPSQAVRVHHTVTDAANTTRTVARDTLSALSPGARDTSTFVLKTENLPGSNQLTGEVTSDGPPERLTSNNAAVRNFLVQADRTAPSLTVLANGRDLPPTPSQVDNLQDPNLPFVSSQPSFEIRLRDDNPYLSLNDTSYVEVYLKGGLPNRDPALVSGFRQIPFSSNRLSLVPADSSEPGSMHVLFEPDLQTEDDSTYTLKIEAQDNRGNEIEPYQASFRVQKKQVIRDVYPYPNPMSTQTTFAFRIEGGRDELLRDFALRIYTLSGRLIREFNRTDLDNPLGVGWNTVTWNGRDADGDRVATGVYLYRVRVKSENETFRGDVEKVTVIR